MRKLRKLLRCLPDELYIKLQFFRHYKKTPNLKDPQTFNEKLQWLKLHDRKTEYTTMVDKHLVKQYVADKIGKEYIVPTLGVWESAEQIDFDALPDQFALKCNHDGGSSSVLICRDKKTFDRQAAVEKLNGRLDSNGYWYGREWPYKDVKPCIIAEQYLDGGEGGLTDYKFYCFNGEPKFLYVSKGLEDHHTAAISFLTLDWEFAPYGRSDFRAFDQLPAKPSKLEEMIDLAGKLSANCDFLRVDFYQVGEQVYFSELTFYPCSGYMPFADPAHDLEMGKMLKLTK